MVMTMSKVYVLLIQNYDALDGYMTSNGVEVFTDKAACDKWMEQEESTRQTLKGFKPVDHAEDPGYWEFVKEDERGTYTHDFFGQYRNVIGGGDVD